MGFLREKISKISPCTDAEHTWEQLSHFWMDPVAGGVSRPLGTQGPAGDGVS